MDFKHTAVIVKAFTFCLFVLILYVQICDSGECCRSHYDTVGFRRHEIWCRDYCCSRNNPYRFTLYCCNDPRYRAGYGLRDEFCVAWFKHPSNIWVPILIGIIALAVMIALCGCCFCFCC